MPTRVSVARLCHHKHNDQDDSNDNGIPHHYWHNVLGVSSAERVNCELYGTGKGIPFTFPTLTYTLNYANLDFWCHQTD